MKTRRRKLSPSYANSLLLAIAMTPVFVTNQNIVIAEPPSPEASEKVSNKSPEDQPAKPVAISLADADELFMSGKYEQALTAYDQLAAADNTRIEATLGSVRCLTRTGQHELALTRLTELSAKDNADWQTILAQVLGRTGDYEAVINHCKKALSINPDHAGARLLWGQTLEMLGRRDQAIEVYRWFDKQMVSRTALPEDAAWLTDAALGFLRYSTLTKTNLVSRTKHVLTQMLQQAYGRLDRSYWPARIAAADLLRDKHNNDDTDGSVSDYQAALRINPNLVEAHVGLGLVALESWDFTLVEKQVEKALAIDPGYAPALHLQAQRLITERRYEEANEPCEQALQINPHDIEALALMAAAAACRFDDARVGALSARVQAINENSVLFHLTLGNALGGIRQYAASEKHYELAIKYEPTDANARTELGMMYMQWGLEDKAREALLGSWSLDPFNQRTKFTLDLLDSLQAFDTVESDHFIVHFDAKRDPTLGTFASKVLEDVYDLVTADYSLEPKDKTIIEIFPTSRSFAVRITGKPWIHTVGACTGRVIALSSPRTGVHLLGAYDLRHVLTHEFTHTVTLAATNNRIPHWFTEGLAVMQEDSPLSFAWQKLLAEAARRNELFTLKTIDWGFMRPKKPTDRQLAYAQSEWMCRYIVERYGYDKISAMLAAYRQGFTQAEVFEQLLQTTMRDFSQDFQKSAEQQIKQWGFDLTPPEDVELVRKEALANPNNATIMGRLSKAELDAGFHELALKAAKSAIAMNQNEDQEQEQSQNQNQNQNQNQLDALEVFVNVMGAQWEQSPSSQQKKAVEKDLEGPLNQLLSAKPNHGETLALAANIELYHKQWDKAETLLKKLQAAVPANPASWQGLSGIYLSRGDDDKALLQMLELARHKEHDEEIAAAIAGIYRKRGVLPEAFYWYKRALDMSPMDVDLHRQLGDTLMQAGKTADALAQYTTLTKLDSQSAKHFELAATAAYKLGDTDQAIRLARRAVALDANSPAASLLP